MIRSVKYLNQFVIWLTVAGLVLGMSNFTPPKFDNIASVQAAQVAITTTANTTFTSNANIGGLTVFTSDQVGYAFFMYQSGTSEQAAYSKTTDGGANWSAATLWNSQADLLRIAIWYDGWTPGVTTGYIHLVATDSGSDDLWYNRLNTANDTLLVAAGSTISINAGLTTTYAATENTPAISRSTNGYLYAAVPDTSTSVSFLYKCDITTDCNLTAEWTSTSDPLDEDAGDLNLIMPLSGGNAGSVMVINNDISADLIRYNIYNGSSWGGWNNIVTGVQDNTTYDATFGAAVNPINGDIYLIYVDVTDTAGTLDGDEFVNSYLWDNSANNWNARTQVAGASATRAHYDVSVSIDSTNGDVYAFYTARTTPATATTGNIYYKVSTDQMNTWGNEQGPVNASGADDIAGGNPVIINSERIYIGWYENTEDDFFGNTVADLTATKMMLFFDGSSVPSGWRSLSDGAYDLFYQVFPRGAAGWAGTSGVFGGNTTHGHAASISGSTPIDAPVPAALTGTAFSDANHTHSGYIATPDSQTLLPSYREIQIIQYDAGVPTGATAIPSGAIALFDATVPSGWTRYSAQDDTFIRTGPYNASPPTGGAASHAHTTTIVQGVGTSSGTPTGNTGAFDPQGALQLHTHTWSNPSTDTVAHTPLNTDFIIGQINSNGPEPGDMLAMFTGNPGTGWTRTSGSGEDHYQRFFEGKSSYAADGGGASTHNHTNNAVITSVPNLTSQGDKGFGALVSSSTHVHTLDVSYTGVNDLPPYVDVLLYKSDPAPAYTPDARNWRIYDAENVADPANTTGTDDTAGDAITDEETDDTPAAQSTRIMYKGNAIKLRIVIGETNSVAGTNVKYRLQFDTDSGFPSPVNVEAQGGTNEIWRYYDGGDNVDDGEALTVRLAGNSPSAGQHNEDASVGSGFGSDFDPAASTNYEHEFTIQVNPEVLVFPIGATYFFRLQYMENSDADGGSWTTVAKNASNSFPQLRLATNDLELSRAPSSVTLGEYNLGGSGTLSYEFLVAEGLTFWDKRGTDTAYNVTVATDGLAKDGGGDIIIMEDMTWQSAAADLTGSFASSTSGMAGQDAPTAFVGTVDAYIADPGTEGKGGFFFSPTVGLTNLNDRTAGTYTGLITVTIV